MIMDGEKGQLVGSKRVYVFGSEVMIFFFLMKWLGKFDFD